jgi:hypothetical protein
MASSCPPNSEAIGQVSMGGSHRPIHLPIANAAGHSGQSGDGEVIWGRGGR